MRSQLHPQRWKARASALTGVLPSLAGGWGGGRFLYFNGSCTKIMPYRLLWQRLLSICTRPWVTTKISLLLCPCPTDLNCRRGEGQKRQYPSWSLFKNPLQPPPVSLGGTTRETREGLTELTVETEANGDVWSTNEGRPTLDGSLASSCRYKRFLFMPWLLGQPSKTRVFWAPNGTCLLARCHFTGPKILEFHGPNPLPLSLVMDMHASKTLCTGPYKS
jgi:hypothetical protein